MGAIHAVGDKKNMEAMLGTDHRRQPVTPTIEAECFGQAAQGSVLLPIFTVQPNCCSPPFNGHCLLLCCKSAVRFGRLKLVLDIAIAVR